MGAWSKIGLLVAFLITVGYIVMLSGVTPTVQPRKTPAPEGFVAANFQSLADLKGNEHFDVVNLNADGDPFHPGLMIDPRVVYITVSTGPYDAFYIFINSEGREIGRREKHRTSFPIANTIVDVNGYYTVTANAVGDTQAYKDVNNRELVTFEDIKDLNAQSTYYRSFSYHDFPRESADYKEKINTYVFQIDGAWVRARVKHEDGKHLDWKNIVFPKFTVQHEFIPEGDTSERITHYGGGSFNGDKYTIHQTWFDQQEYFRRRAASIGSTTGQGRPEHWRGTGYYRVRANDKSIGFAIPNDMLNLSGSGRRTLSVMGHEKLDFILIERYVSNRPQYTLISTKD